MEKAQRIKQKEPRFWIKSGKFFLKMSDVKKPFSQTYKLR